MLYLTVFLTDSSCVEACLGGGGGEERLGGSARRAGLEEDMARTQLMESSENGKEPVTVTFCRFVVVVAYVYTLVCVN